MNIIGETVIDGVPYINGVACKPAPEGHYSRGVMKEAFAPWICPHCNAALGIGLLCLNLCGMSHASARKFNDGLAAAAARVKAREKKA